MKLQSLIMMAFIGFSYAKSNEESASSKPPNIVIIMADDLGIDDVSFHGQKQHITPNIDALAYHGMILNHHYTPPICTPSRSAFMSGKFPIHTGTQHFVHWNDEPWGLPLNVTTIGDIFKEAGYGTNLIGKWNLGFSQKAYLPTSRGFDSYYGYLGGYIDYYSRKSLWPFSNASIGFDFRRNLDLECESEGTYITDLFTTEAEAIIDAQDTEKPLLLMVNHLAPHTANDHDPLQAPENEVRKFDYIEDEKRRVYAAMISKLDESIGNITRALDKKQILNNTIIVLYSDNGAPTLGFLTKNGGSNYPLRGQKNSPWEGGLRVAGAIWSPLLKNPKTVFNQKMYVADWLPTLARAADIKLNPDLKLDGLDLWEELSSGNTKPFDRDIVHLLDDISGVVSIMSDGFKYIKGTTNNGKYDFLLSTRNDEQDPRDIDYANTILNSTTSRILAKYETYPLTVAKINTLRASGEITCQNQKKKNSCDPLVEECLYQINEDPCEKNNLANLPQYESVLHNMRVLTDKYRSSAVAPANKPSSLEADPSLHNCIWTWFTELPTENRISDCMNERITCPGSSDSSGSFVYLFISFAAIGILLLCFLFFCLHVFR